MTDTATLSQEIDQLLEQYLGLLDQYTTLREQLSTLQSSIQQNLARANFTAERGVRYGKDYYDERMQASRTCAITPDGAFTIVNASLHAHSNDKDDEDEDGDEDKTGLGKSEIVEKKATDVASKRKDPIRMFGILTPQALRAAQGEAVKMVEGIIPKLVGVGKEMEVLEIEVRRRRKWLGKASSVAGKGEEGVRKARAGEGERGGENGLQLNGVACEAN